MAENKNIKMGKQEVVISRNYGFSESKEVDGEKVSFLQVSELTGQDYHNIALNSDENQVQYMTEVATATALAYSDVLLMAKKDIDSVYKVVVGF